MARSILDQAMPSKFNPWGTLGHIRDLDRTLAGTLMAEFSRVQLIVQEEVVRVWWPSGVTFLAACSAFLTDVGRVMDRPPADPR